MVYVLFLAGAVTVFFAVFLAYHAGFAHGQASERIFLVGIVRLWRYQSNEPPDAKDVEKLMRCLGIYKGGLQAWAGK